MLGSNSRFSLARRGSSARTRALVLCLGACALLGCSEKKHRPGTSSDGGTGGNATGSGGTSATAGSTGAGGGTATAGSGGMGGGGGGAGAGGQGGDGFTLVGFDVERISVSSDGAEADSGGVLPDVSDDGRYVVFDASPANVENVLTDVLGYIVVRDVETQTTTLVSVSSDGVEANGTSSWPCISGDGRYVAFNSRSSNLTDEGEDGVFVRDLELGITVHMEGSDSEESASLSSDGRYVAFVSNDPLVVEDTNLVNDVYVYDQETEELSLVSVSSAGDVGTIHSRNPSLSGDGRYVAFESLAPNLVEDDDNDVVDVFVHDRASGTTILVGRDSNGAVGDGGSRDPSISADGRYVVFSSGAPNLVDDDTNDSQDVFLYDRGTETTERISVSSDGTEGNSTSAVYKSALSDDGRYVVFESIASSLVPMDYSSRKKVLLRDRQNGTTSRLSVNADGVEGDGVSQFGAISGDGSVVVFASHATNLVRNDDNDSSDIFLVPLP